jgi:exonuclease SbcC
MITRIILDNYMSHARTVIEPAPGLTVILGPNNCGKSAIVSALQTLCGDNDGDFMVRHGEKTCQVTVETDDGHTIAWRRKSKSVSYVLDGVEVHRVGRGNLPDNLNALLRLPKVNHPNGEKQFDVHFGDQKSPIFLIDRESDTAAFFSTASDAEKLLEMQKRHKDKVRDARRKQQDAAKDAAQVDALLGALSPLDAINAQLDAVEQTQRHLLADDQAIEALSLLIEQIEKQNQLVTFRAAVVQAAAELRSPPDLLDLQPLQALIDNLANTSYRAQRLHEQSRALAAIQQPPPQTDTAPLEQDVSRLTRAIDSLARITATRQSLAPLTDPPAPQDSQALADFLNRFQTAHETRALAAARQAALANLVEPTLAQDPAPLADLIDRITRALTTASQQLQAIADHDQHLNHLDADINAWLWANPACPTCGGPTTRENLLTGAHAHAPQAKGAAAHE